MGLKIIVTNATNSMAPRIKVSENHFKCMLTYVKDKVIKN